MSRNLVRHYHVLYFHVLHFHVLYFHVLQFHALLLGPSFSNPAFSRPAFSAPSPLRHPTNVGLPNNLLLLTRTESDQTDAQSFLVAEVNHWLGMSQSAPQWPIHTWPLQVMQQEPSPNKSCWQEVSKIRRTVSSLRVSATSHLATPLFRFWWTLITRFQNVLANHLKYSFQRISVLVQRFNSVLFHHTFSVEDDADT